MKIVDIEQDTIEWLQWRQGKVTGSKLNKVLTQPDYNVQDIVDILDRKGIEYRKGSRKDVLLRLLPEEEQEELTNRVKISSEGYDVLAGRLCHDLTEDEIEEKPHDRGHALEPHYFELYKLKIANHEGHTLKEKVSIESSENKNWCLSPDALVYKGDELVGAVEVKCLGKSRHLKVLVEKEVPKEIWDQIWMYFIVMPNIQFVDLGFYDDRFIDPRHKEYTVRVKREKVQNAIDIKKKGVRSL